MKIQFVDLKRMHEGISGPINDAIQKVVKQGDFILGKDVEAFEREFASYCGAKYAAGVSSGTDALRLILVAMGIGESDEVIVPANTFIATALAVSFAGAKPVLVDADPKTLNIDVTKIESSITKKTKALMPVHLYGNPADMDKINKIALKHGLKVVEDACQAHGAASGGKKTGSLSAAAAFSFYPAKNIGAFGDAGAVVTDDIAVYEKLMLLRNYGSRKKYEHDIIGFNSRLDTIQAAVLRAKLPNLDKWNDSRRAAAKIYRELLSGINGLTLPPEDAPGTKQVYHLFVIRTKERDRLRDYLKSRDIDTGIHYPIPIHLCPAYSGLGHKAGSFPVTEKLAAEVLSLPMFPFMTEEELKYVSSEVRSFFK